MAIILASQSPRRRELLTQLGVEDFLVIPARGEEQMPQGVSPARLVEELSRQKATEVARGRSEGDIILGADTVVALDGKILGKPANEEEAKATLRALSGRAHQVYTGVTLIRGSQVLTAHEETVVYFRTLTEEEIDWYVSTGEPMDKAGSYGIQGKGGRFIPRIQGDYTNVVGLPICLVGELLAKLK